MYRSYYDYSQKGGKESAPATEPGERTIPEPYGEVPGPAPASGGGVVPQPTPDAVAPQAVRPVSLPRAAERALRGSPAVPPRPATPRGGKGGKRFALFFTWLLIFTGIALIVQGGLPQPTSPLDVVGELWDRIDPFYDWDYYQSEAWADDLASTTVERAPTGDGTVLTLAAPAGYSLTPSEIYAKVSPAVVGIRATLENGIALGTGVTMSSDGYIITNAHVIAGAGKVSVTLSDDSRKSAKLVGYDGETDLAVLKIDARDLPTAEFGDSSLLRVGEVAYAIGNPLGEELRGTMTDGIISAIDRLVDMNGQEMTLIQTNAALNSGNSGGALINAGGQVVGITNMKMMSDWETIEGLGFAIPTAQAKKVVDQIIDKGFYAGAPLLGITVTDHYGENGERDGARVESVKKDSEAYLKLFAGDVIVAAQGEPVTCTDDLLRIKDRYAPGDEILLQVRPGASEEGGEEPPVEEIIVKLTASSQLTHSEDSYAGRREPG